MTTEESSERMDLRAVRREQERERRRMRDRQRRQSMSLEEREKHLARRRRNYQLRRQRAGHAKFNSQLAQMSIGSREEQNTGNEHQGITNASELSVQCDGMSCVGFNQGQDKLNAVCTKVEGLEVGPCKLAKFPRRVRLNHIRHLARSLNDPVGELSGDNQIGADVIAKEDATTKSMSPKRLRLNCVKRLARALNSSQDNTDQNHQNETEVEQNLSGQEIQLTSSDVLKLTQSNEDEDKKKTNLY